MSISIRTGYEVKQDIYSGLLTRRVEKSEMKVSRRHWLVTLIFAMMILSALPTQAATARSRAIEAYRSALIHKKINVGSKYEYFGDISRFAIADINADKVPELAVYGRFKYYKSNSVTTDKAYHIFTYRNGKFMTVTGYLSSSKIAYYPGTGTYSGQSSTTGYTMTEYGNLPKTGYAHRVRKFTDTRTRKINCWYLDPTKDDNKSIKLGTFKSYRDKWTKGKSPKYFKFHSNTKANRTAYLK